MDATLDFSTLCLPHQSDLLGFAARLTMSRDSAQDLVQDTLTRALRAWDKFDPGDENVVQIVRSWLFRICMNRFITIYHRGGYRRRRSAERRADIIMSTYGIDQDGHDPRSQDDGIGDEVSSALASLDRDHREVVVRADFHNEKYADIASDLGVPIGTVMSRLHRARRRLGVLLAEYAEQAYGIRRSGGAGEHANAVEATERPQSKPDRVERVVARHDRAELVLVQPGPDARAAG
jgi:RNA polymerase sigma-70 factor (ECF subfamily)